MKIRSGFVSNSSSSSFICVTAGPVCILETSECDESGYSSIGIDKIIEELIKAKEQGATDVGFSFGGSYEG